MIEEYARLCAIGVRYVDMENTTYHSYDDILQLYTNECDVDVLYDFEKHGGTVGSFFQKKLPVGAVITRWYLHLVDCSSRPLFVEFTPNQISVFYRELNSTVGEVAYNFNTFLDFHVREAFRFPLYRRPKQKLRVYKDREEIPNTLFKYISSIQEKPYFPAHVRGNWKKESKHLLTPGAYVALVLRSCGTSVEELALRAKFSVEYLEDLFAERIKPDLSEYEKTLFSVNDLIYEEDQRAISWTVGAFPLDVQKKLQDFSHRLCFNWIDEFMREFKREKEKNPGIRVITYDDVKNADYQEYCDYRCSKWLL